MAQFLTRYRMYWGDRWVEGGTVIDADSPADDGILAYWGKWMAVVPYEPPPPPENGGSGDGGGGTEGTPLPEPGEPGEPEQHPTAATPPMTSTQHPSHVGRRTRP